MGAFTYTVQMEQCGNVVSCASPEEVFTLLKNEELIAVFRYNDDETGAVYREAADERQLSIAEREARPVLVTTVLSDEGIFVESEAFWIENYMTDEFYNPERMPYVEKVISSAGDAGAYGLD